MHLKLILAVFTGPGAWTGREFPLLNLKPGVSTSPRVSPAAINSKIQAPEEMTRPLAKEEEEEEEEERKPGFEACFW